MQHAKDIVRRTIRELWNDGRAEAIDEHYARDYVNHNPIPGMAQGRDGEKQTVHLMRRAFPDLHTTINEVVAEGDKVAVAWTAEGTHKGEFMGASPTNRRVRTDGLAIYRVEDDKIAEEWGQADMVSLLTQIGVLPEMQVPAASGTR